MKVIIPAAGLGTRLDPITRYIPKPLLHLNTKICVLKNIVRNLLKTELVKPNDITVGIRREHYDSFFYEEDRVNYYQYETHQNHSGFNDLMCLYELFANENEHTVVVSADNLISYEDLKLFISASIELDHEPSIAYIRDYDEEHLKKVGQVYLDKYGRVKKIFEKPGKILSKNVACSLYFIPKTSYGFMMYSKKYYHKKSEFGDVISALMEHTFIRAHKLEDYWIDVGSYDRWMKAIEIFNNS